MKQQIYVRPTWTDNERIEQLKSGQAPLGDGPQVLIPISYRSRSFGHSLMLDTEVKYLQKLGR